MTDSLSINQLINWLEGRLPEDEAEAVAAAVQADESHKATVAWLRTFLGLSKSTVLVEPPEKLSREAATYYKALAQEKRKPSWLQRLVATLTSDSWQRPSLVGVRHTRLDAEPRQLIYTATTADIVLNTQAGTDRNRFDLIGQVLPTDESDPASYTVQLMQQEQESALAYTDELGKFTFVGLQPGVYTIILRGDQAEITIADIELSA